MSDLDAFLEGIVADPAYTLRWLVMADYLEENGQPERAELVRVHRELLRTCTATRETKARKQLHARMMELMRAGVGPCLPQRTITLPGGVEMRFSFIPPGSFLMGSPKSEAGRDTNERRHFVTLTRGFWLGQTPVTQRQWTVIRKRNPSHFAGNDLPVEQVNWEDAVAYSKAISKRIKTILRLPTEAEWEYAARSGTATPYFWGATLDGTQANCNGSHPYGDSKKGPYLESTTPVGRYTGASPHPWSLIDVLGNVSEWCAGWHGDYPANETEATDPTGPESGTHRVWRGGDWCGYGKWSRVAFRHRFLAGESYRSFTDGLRLAADLSALA